MLADSKKWELYLNVDRSELNNLADQYPDKVKMENDIRLGNVVWLF